MMTDCYDCAHFRMCILRYECSRIEQEVKNRGMIVHLNQNDCNKYTPKKEVEVTDAVSM